LCNLTKQELVGQLNVDLLGKCPVEGCGLPVGRHRDENASNIPATIAPSAGQSII